MRSTRSSQTSTTSCTSSTKQLQVRSLADREHVDASHARVWSAPWAACVVSVVYHSRMRSVCVFVGVVCGVGCVSVVCVGGLAVCSQCSVLYGCVYAQCPWRTCCWTCAIWAAGWTWCGGSAANTTMPFSRASSRPANHSWTNCRRMPRLLRYLPQYRLFTLQASTTDSSTG